MKSRGTALLLAIFGGFLGIHRFYLGQTGYGIFYIFTFGGIGILWIADVLVFLLGSSEGFDNKYNKQRIQREQMAVQRDMLSELKKSNTKS